MDPLKSITLNQYVLVRLPSDNVKICELKPNGIISLGKFGSFEVNDIIGYQLGTTFEIFYEEKEGGDKNDSRNDKHRSPLGKIKVMENAATIGGAASDEENTPQPELVTVDNSDSNKNLINVGNKIQKLSMEEIELLKKQTISGEEIIAKMIESHGSFHKKTIYSQEKYLKRKKQKFAKFFTVEYLSSTGLLNYLIDKGDTLRVMDMSQETLGMILNLANIRSSGTYLCVDETGGLMVYAMLERMFGGDNNSNAEGKIVMIHENEHPNLDLLKYSNYSEEFITQHVKTISILDYFEPPTLEDVKEAFCPLSDEELKEMKSNKKGAYYRRLKWYNNQLEIIDLATEVQYDGLVVASTLHLPTFVPRLSERVHGSRPIVCYSQFKEALLELSHSLYSDLRFLAPTLMETRCRPYQTIRGRLHPLMTMKGSDGYLLWCHRVIPFEEPETNELESTDAVVTCTKVEGEADLKKQKVE